ncbi:biotin synthase BioB [Moraxella boevrei]|uniref:biotin synthase BioB n=1 Tax=Faucicola boevrei TaxID=346665 RepID=UPI003736D41F
MASTTNHNLKNTPSRNQIQTWFELPLMDLLLLAQQTLREHFPKNTVQISTLLSIKTGNCPEDCGYCSQSGHHRTDLQGEKKLAMATVIEQARLAKAKGSSRFCMGAGWRNPHDRDMPYVLELVKEVKALGLETCMTLGMLTQNQAQLLADAGLDYYNHNLDTSRDFYPKIIGTRTFDDRLNTLECVRRAGINVCSGGIIGMGESRDDRIDLLFELANLPTLPQSIPINMLVPIKGTPVADKLGETRLPVLEWARTIAVARLCCPTSYVRISAGREQLSDAEQALLFMAGANSFFYGDKLLTTDNATTHHDDELIKTLGLTVETAMPRQIPITDAVNGRIGILNG